MLLHYYLDEKGNRVYTLKKYDPQGVLSLCLFVENTSNFSGQQTKSAHPAKFSPEDKHSKERMQIKKRFGLLPTQQPKPTY